jgi:sucrose-6-phosphate hydrolase SacC (GH32 family)
MRPLSLAAGAAAVSVAMAVNQCVGGPCGPAHQLCGPTFDTTSPQFHIRDLSCGENDPNFPFYDTRSGLTHHFWQAHLEEPQGGVGQGPTIGHAVSADAVRWAHLPVALWNDQPYDNVAVYTGSATIVNGSPVLVYPGLCVKADWPQCGTGTVFAVAVPAASVSEDPLLTNWTKPSYNPIVENVQRDPSTAWTANGGAEWRFTNYEGKVYTSPDFTNWSQAEGGALFPTAECPDFFPVPAVDPSASASAHLAPRLSPTPTHVHKQSSGGQDWYTFGVYTDGPVGTTGNWTVVGPALQPLDASAYGSSMRFYASKSYLDPVGENGDGIPRRIYYGWALVPPASVQTLARVTTFHPTLGILLFNPLPELAGLRDPEPLAILPGPVVLPANSSTWLGDWAGSLGNQSEVTATFTLPTAAGPVVTFGLEVLVGASPSGGGGQNVSTPVTVTYDPATRTANVTAGGQEWPTNTSYFMVGWDLPGDDDNVTNVNYTDPHICQAACTDDPTCSAYTYVVRPPLYASCCLKVNVPALNPDSRCTSGVKPGRARPGGTVAALPLLPTDTAVDVRIFVDNTFLEVFVMGGRLAFTVPINTGAESGAAGMNLIVSGGGAAGVTVQDVSVWHLDSIWTTTDEVLKTAAEARRRREERGRA